MKKIVKTLTAVATASLAVIGGVYVFRKFFAKDEELDEAFDDEELFEAESEDDDIAAFDDESEIFEDETPATPAEAPDEKEEAPAQEAPVSENPEEKEEA